VTPVTNDRPLTCDEVRDLAPLYVADALDPADEAAVRAHLATCSDAHDEVAGFAGTIAALLETVEPAEPPAGLRTRLLAAAAADLAEGRHPASAVARVDAAAPMPIAPAPIASIARVAGHEELDAAAPIALASWRPSWAVRVGAIAAAIAIVVLGGLGLSLKGQLDAVQAYRDGVSQALALAARPGSQAALLAADDGSVSGLGVVGADGTVRLAMRGLAATSGSQVYTAWAIGGDGIPVAIGELTVAGDGTAVAVAHAPAAEAGVVLALTLEPHPGATKPGGPIVAKGVARPASG
jgi:hypothetical protein